MKYLTAVIAIAAIAAAPTTAYGQVPVSFLGTWVVDAAGTASRIAADPGMAPENKPGWTERWLASGAELETGGSSSRQRLTAYRQDALRCARELADTGVLKVSVLRERIGVSRAGPILRDNHYGWFDRVKTGHYDLSPKGRRDLVTWSDALDILTS